MNYVGTHIRLPEDLHTRLKIKAVKEKRSLAKVITDAAAKDIKVENKPRRKMTKKEAEKFMRDLDKLAEEISKELPEGFDSVKALREIRYKDK